MTDENDNLFNDDWQENEQKTQPSIIEEEHKKQYRKKTN